jgi:hypothetical protein
MSNDLRTFFNSYNASFGKGPSSIATFYFEPCITARMGHTRLNATQADTEAFFSQVLDKYRSQGFHHGSILSFDSKPIGMNSAIVTIKWAYKDTSDKTLWEWTFSYNMYKSTGAWKILLQTMHDS